MGTNTHRPDPNDVSYGPRDERAAQDHMMSVRLAPEFYQVYSSSGGVYHVDARSGVCDCDDYHYRAPTDGCKHVRRVAQARGEAPIPPVDDVDADLERHRASEMARQGRQLTTGGSTR